jgi:hypothetical protein
MLGKPSSRRQGDPFNDITTFSLCSKFGSINERLELPIERKGGEDAKGPWDKEVTLGSKLQEAQQ